MTQGTPNVQQQSKVETRNITSNSGCGIRVAATDSPGALIRTALSNVAASAWDEAFIKTVNTSASAVKLIV